MIISREITVSALREWMAELGARTNVAVSTVGKYKTAFQMIAITVFLLNYHLGLEVQFIKLLLHVNHGNLDDIGS